MDQKVLNWISSWSLLTKLRTRGSYDWHVIDILRYITFEELRDGLRRRLPDCCCPGQYQECLANLISMREFIQVNNRCRELVSDRYRAEGKRVSSPEENEQFVNEIRELTLAEWEKP